MKYKILLYGLGKEYNRNLNAIKYFELKNEIEVVGVISSYNYSFQELDGYTVLKNEELTQIKYDYIVIMNERHYKEIYSLLVERGVRESDILSYRMFQIPNVNISDYVSLKDSRISIISNNCWGGLVYHSLALECLSPFKNLFLEDDDYIKLLNNLEEYCKKPLVFERYEEEIHDKQIYPVMKLGDIFVHCNHSRNEQEAIRDWERRVKKINFDNLFVEMYTEDNNIASEFAKLSYEKKIVFVPFEPENTFCCQLQLQEEQKEFWEVVNSNATYGKVSYAYNLIELLLGKSFSRI